MDEKPHSAQRAAASKVPGQIVGHANEFFRCAQNELPGGQLEFVGFEVAGCRFYVQTELLLWVNAEVRSQCDVNRGWLQAVRLWDRTDDEGFGFDSVGNLDVAENHVFRAFRWVVSHHSKGGERWKEPVGPLVVWAKLSCGIVEYRAKPGGQ